MTVIIEAINTDKKIATLQITSDRELSTVILREFSKYAKTTNENGSHVYHIQAMPFNCFVLVELIKKAPTKFDVKEFAMNIIVKSYKSVSTKPLFSIIGDNLQLTAPDINSYRKVASVIGARKKTLDSWVVPLSRLYEVYRIVSEWNHPILPSIGITEGVINMIKRPITSYPTMKELFSTKVSDLYSISYTKGLKKEGLDKLKYDVLGDVLSSRPTRYIDRLQVTPFNYAPFFQEVLIQCEITDIIPAYNGKLMIEVKEHSVSFPVVLEFYSGWLANLYKPGDIIIVGVKKTKKNHAYGGTIYPMEEVKTLPVTPVYKQSPKNKITTKVITSCVEEMLHRFDGADLANYVKTLSKPLWKLFEELHFPKDAYSYSQTINELAYLELIYLQILLFDRKSKEVAAKGISKIPTGKTNFMKQAQESLPYSLTGGQSRAIERIIGKLRSDGGEEILLSGDVGSGKTTVAHSISLYTVDCGYQAALVGPTTILAEQLYNTLVKFIAPLENKPAIAYLDPKSKAAEKREILKRVRTGEINILVGGHGVLNIDEWSNLGLVLIDEQQKFGSEQRQALKFARKDGKAVDIVAQTATPIPRSTALAFYGDIDLITLDEKPAGRKENITRWIKQSSEDFLKDLVNPVWEHMFSEIDKGRQVFIVTPAVSEDSKTSSVKKIVKALNSRYKDKLGVTEVHGAMTKEKQGQAIKDFRDKKFDVLVASSIVEVGIDIPNATIILVLDADRFGASSLHQIRGRVGRNSEQGYCYLVSDKTSGASERRLGSLVDSNDGFKIALVDLETRNQGDIFGTKQSGESNLRFCDLADHSKLIEAATLEAKRIWASNDKLRALEDAQAFLIREES